LAKLAIKDLTAEALQPYVGQQMRFGRPAENEPAAGGHVTLELWRVTAHENITNAEKEHPERYPQRRRQSFSALFVLPQNEQPLGMGLHRIMHSDFEVEEWFLSRVLVPSGDNKRAYYEAVFG
jgi:hypothetical protein